MTVEYDPFLIHLLILAVCKYLILLRKRATKNTISVFHEGKKLGIPYLTSLTITMLFIAACLIKVWNDDTNFTQLFEILVLLNGLLH